MSFVLFLLFVAMPFVELALLIYLGQQLGFWPTIAIVIVTALFAGAILQFVILVMPPLVEVTDRRIVRRRRLGWEDPDTMRLDAIEDIRQQGWRLVITGGGRSLSVFCPPPFAPRLRRAIAGA